MTYESYIHCVNTPVTTFYITKKSWRNNSFSHPPESHLWLNCFGHHMFLLCISSKQKLKQFPKVDHCACSFSLWKNKVPIYTTNTKAINADEWLAMASLFKEKKVSIISTASSLYHFDRARHFHTPLLLLWNSVLCISLFLIWKKNEK